MTRWRVNPNFHVPLKVKTTLRSRHRWQRVRANLCQKSWIYNNFSRFPAFFWLYSDSCPPHPPVLEKNAWNTRDFMFYLNTFIMLRALQKFYQSCSVNPFWTAFVKKVSLITQKVFLGIQKMLLRPTFRWEGVFRGLQNAFWVILIWF